jgi:hypothetical protein
MKVTAAVFVAPLLLLPVVAGSVAASVAVTPPAGDRHELFIWVPEGGYPNRFPFGQCTWWAARNHRVTWWGNAADWLRNARAQSVATSEVPSIGAIVVYRPGGLYSELGHVAIVVATTATSYTVSEMNAQRWGVVSIRTLPWPDSAAAGFIPVDAPARERRVSVDPTGAVSFSIVHSRTAQRAHRGLAS